MTAHHRAPTDPRPAPFEQVRAFAAGVEAMVTSEDMARKPHTELEEMLAEKGRQWARMMLEENLRLRAEVLRQGARVVGVRLASERGVLRP